MDPNQFDSELKTYYRKIKSDIKQKHQQYIGKHPELREILNDFLSQVLLEKPNDVYDYAREYFSYFNIEEDKTKFHPLIICGPDGVGKTTVIQRIINAFPQIFEKSISYTTRAPLLSETHGLEYYFVSKNEFEKEKQKESFIENIQKGDGNYFGTHLGKLNAIVNSGKIAILELDVQGAKAIYDKHPEWKFIFLSEKLDVCEKRMNEKQFEQHVVQEKLKTAQVDLQLVKDCPFFYEITNTVLEETYNEINIYIKDNYTKLDI